MAETFNIYCDESCHLEHDRQKVMVLGALSCPAQEAGEIAISLRDIKARHGLSPTFESKWTKVSGSKQSFYLDSLDYFFAVGGLRFRALVVPDKSVLQHEKFKQTHDDWYYKMYFTMLKALLRSDACFRIYLDYKDTWGGVKVKKLHEVLSNSIYDFSMKIVERVQIVRSHEVEQLQLCDLLLGAVAYANRGLSGNAGKMAVVQRMQERSHLTLTRTTLLGERKVNLLLWNPARAEE
ncbi:MAG: DUF3800 domain-containing protein [candidate division WOR-3 bacterium]|nr:DUF3800 domain-containing protein [candidate division WOR-3 bacterium]